MQLNKYLALCGVTSRRKANYLIMEGRVSLNGDTVRKLGIVVDPKSDQVRMDGQLIEIPGHYRYVLFNKPAGIITSAVDGRGRRTVIEAVGLQERVFPVGRLDLDTEGVLLLTNDGDLAYRLAHPRFEIEKIYQARVAGRISDQAIRQLRRGVEIDPDVVVRGETRLLSRHSDRSLVEIQVHEGKKRQIKRMLRIVGFPVQKLVRINFAGLTVDDLKTGEWRDLSEKEVDRLYLMTGMKRVKEHSA